MPKSSSIVEMDASINEVGGHMEVRANAEDSHSIRSLGHGVRHLTDEQLRGSRLITDAMASVTTMINQIAVATQAQATSSEAIEESLTVFRDISNETSRRAEGMTTMVTTLSERSAKLEREVGRFKTE